MFEGTYRYIRSNMLTHKWGVTVNNIRDLNTHKNNNKPLYNYAIETLSTSSFNDEIDY